jgi:pyruvate, water dikinase
MKRRIKVIAWFEDVNKNDIGLVGGKGANLGELTQAKIPVPPGFIVTSEAYFDFIRSTKLEEFISHYLKDLDVNDSNALTEVAEQIKAKINSSTMPDFIVDEIKTAYAKLGNISVAVRSSATAEDLPEASFAGQQRTFLNVKGESDVVKAVQGCWASLFEPRAIFYRAEHNFDHLKVGIAVPVQKMVESEASGVMFTIEPLRSDISKILIEGIFGLGELIVSGDVTPDQYLLEKETLKILEKHINKQEWQLVATKSSKRDLESNEKLKIPADKQGAQKLSDTDIVSLAKIGKTIEQLYGSSQDIEWAKEKDKLYIVQARPVTTIKETAKKESLPDIKEKPVLTGVAASPGIMSGKVRIVMSISEIEKVKPGDVLVAEMTTPDFVPAMKRAVAIVTDRGGRTAHAAIVSRELSIPCVVGTGNATKTLKDGQEITVDGFRGTVYSGRVTENRKAGPTIILNKNIKTKTKIYVNLAEPELAETIAARNVDGVGLLRAEFMVAHIGGHPRFMLHEGKREQFVDALTKGIGTFTKAFYPRPVVYRATDFKTNEYRNLKGGERYEEVEENPMIGYRGCSRYTHELDVFRMEIEAIKSIRRDYDNLYVMIPFVRFVNEIVQIKSFLKQEGLYDFPNFKLWMMVEVPSNILLIDKFIDAGIDGISIGSNDLTQLVLGIDRDNAKLAPLFDERNEAVMMAIERAVTTAAAKGITASICGQAPSVYPEITEKLVKWGITSVSVSPDMIDETRGIVAAAEAKMGKK